MKADVGKSDTSCVGEINEYGDIRCPFCGQWIIAPFGYGYRRGIGLCKLCGAFFIILAEIAAIANARLESSINRIENSELRTKKSKF